MENKFEELKNYFLNLGFNDVLIKSNRRSFIEMSWIFTNLIDREVIKRAIANIIKENNNKYEEECRCLGNNPNNIKGFEVIRDNGRLIFQALGADNRSKLNITDQILERDQNIKIKTITYSQLKDEIMKVLNNKKLDEANSKLVLAGINTAFNEACGNLLDYYKYLLEQKRENSKHVCIINQKRDEGESKTKKGGKAHPRTSDLIEYSKREKMLKKLNPDAEIDVKEVDEDVYDAYTAFVYHNDLLKDINEEKAGRLFICEPIGGDRLTRIFYLTDEEFEQFKIEKGNDKLAEIVKHFLDMSNDEFSKQHGTITMSHTNFESYAERINFFLRGSKGKSLTNLKKYTEYIRKLYKDPEIELPYYKPKTGEDLGEAGSSVSSIDRTAQQAIKDNTKQNEVMVTVEYKEAVVEVLGLINEMEETEKSKIPNEIIQFFEENKSETYKPDIDYSDDIRKLKLKEKTKEILAGLYIDYFCEEDKKQGYINKIRMNDVKKQEILKQKYNVDDNFNNKAKQNSLIVQTKRERVFTKFIWKIKNLLKGIVIH